MVSWGILDLGTNLAIAGPGIPFTGYIGFDDSVGSGDVGGGGGGEGVPIE